MKLTNNTSARILFAAQKTEQATGGGQAKEDAKANAPATPASAPLATDAPEDKPKDESKEASVSVGGITLTLAKLAKLESDWKSSKGRICAAVEKHANDVLPTLSDKERKASAVKVTTNVLDQAVISSRPASVERAAKQLLDRKAITTGDAQTWIAYIRVADALRMAYSLGKLG